MKSILVLHPQFDTLGGAELLALRIVSWLVSQYGARVCLLALGEVNLKQVQSQAELVFPQGSVTTRAAPCPAWIRNREGSLHLLRLAYLSREAKRIADEFDLCISTYNEVDFGRPGFQYVHHPNFLSRAFFHRYSMIGTKNILDFLPLLERLYGIAVSRISKNSVEGFRMNRTAVNSEFMKQILFQEYAIDSTVLYPAFLQAASVSTLTRWEERRNRFVSIGRFSHDKNFLELVDLFKLLSERLSDATFTIVGRLGDKAYYRRVAERARRVGVPVEFCTNISNDQLQEILQTSKYYIGPKKFEHFGLAVLEAARAGCLTFVHDSGGQREIITPPELRYATPQELVVKVTALGSDGHLRKNVFAEMWRGITKFRLDDFYRNLGSILKPLLEKP